MCLRISIYAVRSQLNVRDRSPQSLPELPLDGETMHVMKVIWLLLAACPCMSRGRTDANQQNIPEEILEEILTEDLGNHDMLLSRPKSTKQMSIIRSLLQGDAADDDLFDSSYYRHRNPPHTSKRTQHENRLECCPSVLEKIAPLGGISRRGKLLQLYRDEETIQRFYQSRCLSGIANKPCQYIDKEYTSKCVQLYTYMYAIVKYHNVSQPYRLDYIRVKSGCSCQILT